MRRVETRLTSRRGMGLDRLLAGHRSGHFLRLAWRLPMVRGSCRFHAGGMPNYRRVRVPGGTYLFTVNPLERDRHLLVTRVDALRTAFREARAARPFDLIAAVVLPDHLHCIWTLPPDDADNATRWRHIKSAFSRSTRGRATVGPTRDQGRTRDMATPLLGTPGPRRAGPLESRRLRPHQSPQAWACRPGGGLAVLDVPPLRRAGSVAERLGRWRGRERAAGRV